MLKEFNDIVEKFINYKVNETLIIYNSHLYIYQLKNQLDLLRKKKIKNENIDTLI